MMEARALCWIRRFSAPVGVASPVLTVAAMVLVCAVLAGQSMILAGWDVLAGLFLVPVLVWASVVDIERHILPNALVIPLIMAGLVRAAIESSGSVEAWGIGGGGPRLADALIGAAIGYGFMWGFAVLYRMRAGVDGLGFGDVKLFAASGAWLGWVELPYVMLLAAGLALLSYGVRYVLGDEQWRRRSIAFGPYIAGALWMVWIFDASKSVI